MFLKTNNSKSQSRSTPRPACRQAGITTLLVVAFMGVFTLIMGTLTSYVFEQSKYGRALLSREQAIHVAEAGLEYYKWALARNVIALSSTAPKTYTVNDPEGGTTGTASITPSPNLQCGQVQWIDLTSKGTSNANVGFPRTLNVRYMRKSVAEYSDLFNSGVWFDTTDATVGPVHSNQGIHMNGTNNADVTSPKTTWTCDSSYGCSPTVNNANGVYGGGSGYALWRYGATVPTISFSALAADLPTLKTYAQTSGIMLNPTSVTVAGVQVGSTFSSVGGSTQKGFHLVFLSGGTLDVYRVTATDNINAYSNNLGWMNPSWGNYKDYDHPDITAETKVNATPITIPSGCAFIFSQAKTWIEGTVSGRVTVVAGDTGSFVPDIELPNNITYSTFDGSTGLTAYAEGSVLIPLIIPSTQTVRGLFIAQGGSLERRYYDGTGQYYSVPSADNTYVVRTRLNIEGTAVSSLRPVTQWVDVAGGPVVSGFQTEVDTYDRILAFQPPPFTPAVSTDYGFTIWREQ